MARFEIRRSAGVPPAGEDPIDLSPELARYLDGARKRQRQWPWVRWVLLVIGFVKLGVAVYALSLSGKLDTLLEPVVVGSVVIPVDARMVYMAAVASSVVWVIGVGSGAAGGILVTHAFLRWHLASPADAAILRLYDEMRIREST